MTLDDARAILAGWERLDDDDGGYVPPPCVGREGYPDEYPMRCGERIAYVRSVLVMTGDVDDELACAWHAEHGTDTVRDLTKGAPDA